MAFPVGVRGARVSGLGQTHEQHKAKLPSVLALKSLELPASDSQNVWAPASYNLL